MALSSIRRPASVGEALRPVALASERDIAALIGAISGPRSFELTNQELDALRPQISIPRTELTYALAYLAVLYSHVHELVESGTPYPDAVAATVHDLDDLSEEEKNALQPRLTGLLAARPTHELSQKISRLRAGFIPNAVGFSTLVDLRPNFEGEGDNMRVTGYLLTTQFRVMTDAASALQRRLVFQVTEEGLTEMRNAIDRAECKLRALRNQTSFSSMLVEE